MAHFIRRFACVRSMAVITVTGFALATQIGGGCATSTDDSNSRSSPSYDDRYDDRDYKKYRDEYDDNRISSDARLIKQGRGEQTFRAGSTGRVWVLDERDREVVYTDDLLEGDTFLVNPDGDRIGINGRLKKVELKGDRIYRLYFDGRRVYKDSEPPRQTNNKPAEKPAVKRPVPDSAKMVAEAARGGELSYKAAGNGKVYLYDNDNNALVETFTIKKGQRLTVNVKAGIATLDGQSVMKKGLSQKATYRLLFNQ